MYPSGQIRVPEKPSYLPFISTLLQLDNNLDEGKSRGFNTLLWVTQTDFIHTPFSSWFWRTHLMLKKNKKPSKEEVPCTGRELYIDRDFVIMQEKRKLWAQRLKESTEFALPKICVQRGYWKQNENFLFRLNSRRIWKNSRSVFNNRTSKTLQGNCVQSYTFPKETEV